MEEHSEEWKILNPTKLVETFGYHLARELNEQEVKNLELFASGFKDNKDVHISKVYRSLSNSKIIVMEHVEGVRATDIFIQDHADAFGVKKTRLKRCTNFYGSSFPLRLLPC